MLVVTDTLKGKKERFESSKPGLVSMYVCGITPYDYAHIGHARVYVTFDVLYRLLTFSGNKVSYCRNFTDIDDKLLKRAITEYGDKFAYTKVADTYIEQFKKDVMALNCLPPTYEPRVTEHIPEIITFVDGLVKKGNAYVVDGDVYYRVASFLEYGKLSKQKLDELEVGSRVDVDERKQNPLDFALWKSEAEGTFWKSPWGWGRPGWHIECSALAAHFLGETLDIHAGGMDLIFPHHENEIAQSEGLSGKPFVRYWMHNAFVRINKEKMSKSLGNFFTLKDVFKEVDPMVLRYYILTHHYRAPLDFSFDDIAAVKKSYQRLCRFFSELVCEDVSHEAVFSSPIVKDMLEYVSDDLNTPGMLGVLFDRLSDLRTDHAQACAVKTFLQQVIGLALEPLAEDVVAITPEIQKLIDDREAARIAKDWKKSDQLRDQLKALGVELQDKKQ